MSKQNSNGSAASQPTLSTPTLLAAINVYLEGPGASMASLGKEAHVSTRTIQALKDGKIPHPEVSKPRARAGLAGSLTRLATQLRVSPETVMQESGLALDSATIRQAVSRAGMQAQRSQSVKDETIEAIRGRAALKNQPQATVNVIAMEWPPFFETNSDDTSNSADTSFAYRYMSMMFGGVDSDWNLASLTGCTSIREATDKLLSAQRNYDAIFGLYETTFRRSLGIAYIPIPGISVPLDILVADDLPPGFSWRTVLDRQEYREYSTVRVVVIKDEAGAHVLAGLCRYPGHSLTQCDSDGTNEEHYKQFAEARKVYGTSRTVFFCADQFTCLDVERIAKERGDFKLIRLSDPNVRLPDSSAAQPPAFPVGIAIREQSDFFGELLHEVTSKEIFTFVLPRVARLYVDLFWEPASSNLKFDEQAMEAFLGRDSFAAFREACREAKETKIKESGRDPTKSTKGSFWQAIKATASERTSL